MSASFVGYLSFVLFICQGNKKEKRKEKKRSNKKCLVRENFFVFLSLLFRLSQRERESERQELQESG